MLTLPFPPSVNNLFANSSHGRFTTPRYAAWKSDAYVELLRQPARFARHTGPVRVTYTFGRPDKRRRDVFNLEKAVSDFLVAHGILADDTLIEHGTVQWGAEPGVLVVIETV